MDILIEEMDESLWVAAMKDGQLEDLEVDPAQEEVRWGSVYWGKVTRIDKAMDAAFVDLDVDNTGILHCADVLIPDKKSGFKKGGDVAIGKLLQPGQMIAVQAKSGYVPRLDDMLVLEEDKAPRLSMEITLPGRYLIYSPHMSDNRISLRIRDRKMRKALNKMLDSIENIQGCILRAAAANTQTDILIREANILKNIWDQLQGFFEGTSPQLIMQGPDAVQRTLSDQASQNIDAIEVIVMDHYKLVEEWCEIYAPDLVTRIKPIELDDPHADLSLFDHRDIIGQVESLFDPYVIMPSGANVIIQETAALIAVDVNRGPDERSNLEINIAAAKEIGRQLRLRNYGGIIVADFLKLKTKKEQGQLIATIEEVVAEDPCTVQIHGITNLGLVELTRKQRTPALLDHIASVMENSDYSYE